MAARPLATSLDRDIEQLLSSLAGVVSARVVSGIDGRLEEIHVLAGGATPPKQVVRNVESALRAGFGLEIDRRIVSVAQIDIGLLPPANGMERPAPPPPRTEAASPAPPTLVPASRPARLVFAGFEAKRVGSRRASCRVTLRRGGDEFAGTGEGTDTLQGRAEAAARAVFAALTGSTAGADIAFEALALVDFSGRRHVVVAGRALTPRRSVSLAGSAALAASPEEAAILASLQATNRWAAHVA